MDNIIKLTNECGQEVKFEFLDLINYQNIDYVVLFPVEQEYAEDEDGNEVVILRLEDCIDPEMEEYVSVDDEEILESVFRLFKDRFKSEFDFLEDD